MNLKQSSKAIALLASLSLAACGGGGGSSSSGAPTHNNNGGDGGNGGTAASLQQTAFGNGQVQFHKASALTFNAATLAANTSLTVGSTESSLGATGYFGAVDPAAATAWWDGWTYQGNYDGALSTTAFHPLEAEIAAGTLAPASATCSQFASGGTVSVFGKSFPVCVITDDITADTTLTNNYVYVLNGPINVGAGGVANYAGTGPTLTIEAGTQVYGNADSGGFTGLIVTRGANIDIQGTADQPVIMGGVSYTSGAIQDNPADLSDSGKWGGLVIDGFAKVNAASTPGGEIASEAVGSGATRYFGGSDDADNSGSISHLVIAESGIAFRPDEEIQGLTLEAVGSGTSIDHVQVIGSGDDGIEFFGGKVNLSYVVISGVDDDSLDMDLGYRGTIDHAIIRLGAASGNRGIESDNNGDNFGATPVTAPTLANITILGNSGSDDTTGALHREGFAGKLYRVVIADDALAGGQFDNGCLDVDDVLPSGLVYRNSLFNCSPSDLAPSDD